MHTKKRSYLTPGRQFGIFLIPCLATALLSHIGCGNSQNPDREIQYSSPKLQNVVEHFLDNRTEVLGTIVQVDIQNSGVYTAAGGYFDRSRRIPIKAGDSFIIGSITKVFTAALVLQLVEKGKVKLKAPLIGYLPDDWAAVLKGIEFGEDITVEQALGHRSGLGDVTDNQEFWLDLLADSTGKLTALEILRRIRDKGETKFAPGKSFDYCNTNYLLLGAVVEGASGQSYRTSVQNNIFDRIGLNDTFLSEGTFGSGKERIAHGYYNLDGRFYDGQDIGVAWALPDGGIVSTAEDLIKFYKSLRSGSLFESRDTYKQMIQLVGNNESYGLGLEIVNDPELGLYYCHGGNFCNTRSMLAYFPDNDITIAVCQTFDTRSQTQPSDLMKSVIRDIVGIIPGLDNGEKSVEVGPFILDSLSNIIENEDVPKRGIWDFSPMEVWSFGGAGSYSLAMPGNLGVDDEGKIYLLARESGEISVLDPDGQWLFSFGGYGDGPQFQYASALFITQDNIDVLDIRDNGSKLKTFDKAGTFLGRYSLDDGVSPRVFIDDSLYAAVRSGPRVEIRPDKERLELLSLNGKEGMLLTMIRAEDKLIASTDAVLGRCHVLLDDIEIFPRLITHFDGDGLFLGYSGRYLIKKVDLNGKEKLAFAISGRQKKPLPPKYGENQITDIGQVCGRDMPIEMKNQLVEEYPNRQVFFTEITTDESGFIYIFVPNVINKEKQEVDIFSPGGEYFYRAVIELPYGDSSIRPLVIKNGYLYALIKNKEGENKIKKYKIAMPSL